MQNSTEQFKRQFLQETPIKGLLVDANSISSFEKCRNWPRSLIDSWGAKICELLMNAFYILRCIGSDR
ncbi:Eukaryotic translation initiation factor 3 subunit J [Fusarium oxysporum f. sp. albedinis]|nr:Uncharacterized protein HZ326_29400 [Fusarium oxysporum f. sp. albedinis]KAJ0134819.1 Eukaryotic translation initiation factor 3 subunit J [Fusarium oxysporum f. sp. albedinis]